MKWGCVCEGTRKEKIVNWRVWQYRCNYSAFNGSRYTPSDYSLLICLKCDRSWRTKANYVDSLENYNPLNRSQR